MTDSHPADAATPVRDAPTPFHESFDARDWAKAFMDRFESRRDEIDESLMLAWFANALMRGYDHHATKTEPAAHPSAAPLDLDALERDAQAVLEYENACGGSPNDSKLREARQAARIALRNACTPERILALVAAARRGVEDTEKRGKLWLMLPDGETSYPENDIETMADGLEVGTVEEVCAYQDVGSRWLAIIPTDNPRRPDVRLFGTEDAARAALPTEDADAQ